jgi:aspartate aminotransferase
MTCSSPLGAKHALFLALDAILDAPEDTVLVPSPGWPGHGAAVQAAGGRTREIATDPEGGYRVSVDALDAAWTPDTRALVIANPANPTGAAYDSEHWIAIGAWAVQHDVWLITDDVYGAFVYDREHVHALRVVPEVRDRCVVVDSVSKAHSMTGWRIGWLAGPQPIVDAATRMVSRTVTNVPEIAQIAAHEALVNGAAALRATRTTYGDRRNRAHRVVSAISGVECPLPDGGMFLFPTVNDVMQRSDMQTTTELATWLLEEAQVAVVPSEAFDAPGCLRLCFAVNDDALDAALPRLTTALADVGGPRVVNQ